MAERPARALLDTSSVLDMSVDPDLLPESLAISAITLAAFSAGPAVAPEPAERSRRQQQVQQADALFDPIPFGVQEARAHGAVHAAVSAFGRQPRRRIADLMTAATAIAGELPVVTRNPEVFLGLEELVEVISV